MSPYKITVIAGSNRRESINRRLARALIKLSQDDRFQFELLPIDDHDDIAIDSTRIFLKSFLDDFLSLTARVAAIVE